MLIIGCKMAAGTIYADELAAEGISSTRNRRREPHTAFKWR
jgi:hypothetical protein